MNSASQSQKHQAVPLLTLNGNSCEFHKENLERVVQQNGVGDLPVAIISITGKLRGGKSFFLNYFLRYLQSENKENWIGSQNQPLEGFKWTRSSKGITKGILIWSEIFKIPDSDGNTTAVMLMDTQGTFDQNSTQRDNLTIFGLSMLISSFQIFNIKDQIDESSLQHLANFTEYARLAKYCNSSENPDPSLLFLIRDWSNDHEHPYGETGGLDYMNSKLKVSSDLNDDSRKVRESIKKTFNNLSCFLMPHPGLDAIEDANFMGRKTEMKVWFIDNLKDLIPPILGRLGVKRIDGESVTCNGIIPYIASYAETYSGKTLPEPIMLFDAAMRTTCDQVINMVFLEYEKGMQKELEHKPCMNEDDFEGFHKKYEDVALNTFNKDISTHDSFSHETVKEKHSELEKKLEARMGRFKRDNDKNRKHRKEVIAARITTAVATAGVIGGAYVAFGPASCAASVVCAEAGTAAGTSGAVVAVETGAVVGATSGAAATTGAVVAVETGAVVGATSGAAATTAAVVAVETGAVVGATSGAATTTGALVGTGSGVSAAAGSGIGIAVSAGTGVSAAAQAGTAGAIQFGAEAGIAGCATAILGGVLIHTELKRNNDNKPTST